MASNKMISKKFKDAFEQKCFRLIIDAYNMSISENDIQLDWHENDISYKLSQYIENNPIRSKWQIFTSVEEKISPKVIETKGFADKLPRIDLRMSIFNSNTEYKYFFEAKNLRQNNSALKRRYIATGIDSFVSEKYPNGSLIGYLLNGELNQTINGINALLIKDNRKTETLEFISHSLINSYCESEHQNIGMIKHIFLDFTVLAKG